MIRAPLLAVVLAFPSLSLAAPQVWIEAESFDTHGGWVMDTQFIEIMGSAYLMAHGLGKPVADATSIVQVPEAGEYRVWARCKNWVGPFDATGSPGRFRVLGGDPASKLECGATGKDWQWDDAGTITVGNSKTASLTLHDLTGFDGRCDAILLSKDLAFTPPNDNAATNALRRKVSKLPDAAPESVEYDLVVVGGGYSGMGAEISAGW
jgi:hypothetical protein